MPQTLLDLCCGMGGWSIGFHRAGFECTGIDTLDLAYPYDLILADVRDWTPETKYDVVVASPPCTEFSQLTRLAISRGQRGPTDIKGAMNLVKACVRIIEEAKPRFWILENVFGAVDHISEVLGRPVLVRRPWFLWGKFPPFLLPENPKMRKTDSSVRYGHDRMNRYFAFNPLRSFFRAKIPLPLSVPIGEACRKGLSEEA